MSSVWSISILQLLHLVEHARKRRLQLQSLFDLVGGDIGIFAIFQEAGALMIAHEFDEGGRVGLPVLWKSLKVLKDRLDAQRAKQGDGVLGVLVEIGVEDALIHEVG